MPLYTPTYGGLPIFGLAVHIEQLPQQAAQQLDAFFGVPGWLSVFGGTRGRTFGIQGVLYDIDLPTLNTDEDIFTPGVSGSVADGIATTVRHPRPDLGECRLSWPVPTRPDGPATWDLER